MDLLPDSLFGTDAKVVITGFPGRQVVGHHAPASACANDVEDPIDHLSLRIFGWSSPESGVRSWEQILRESPTLDRSGCLDNLAS